MQSLRHACDVPCALAKISLGGAAAASVLGVKVTPM
jgi:hypothetical protein